MQKEELLRLLQDPDICREIFLIVNNNGKPSAPPAPRPATLPGTDRLAAIRGRLQQLNAEKQKSEADRLAAIKDRLHKKAAQEAKAARSMAEAFAAMDTLSKELSPDKGLDLSKIKDEDADDMPGVPADVGDAFSDKLALLRSHVQKTNEERIAQEKAAGEKKAAADAPEKYTFVLERPCPVCGFTTRVVKCKSRLIAEKTDIDLCVHYKDFNPYLYRVWACEHCGYAADEQRFARHIPEKTQDKLVQFLQMNDMATPFTEKRTSAQAVHYLEMAILFNELTDPSPNRRASLYLIMAWIHRYDGDEEKERAALDKAAELFELSLDTEGYPVDKMSDTMATYLTGAIHFLRKDYDKAGHFLGLIIGNQSMRISSPKLFDMARNMWQDIKDAKAKA